MEIIYSDGDGQFTVVEIIDENTIIVKAKNDFVFRSGKSISFNKVRINNNIKKYGELIQEVKPDKIALSFVEDALTVKKIKQFLNTIHYQGEIFSKIEIQNGSNNIDEVCKESDIIIGRGDLCINTDVYNLYFI